jgi:glycosyltransferase involved in cell wall biosynthesis
MNKKILYIRNGPYQVNLNSYNLQEIGFCKEFVEHGFDCDILYYSQSDKTECIYNSSGRKINVLWRKGIKILRTGIYPSILNKKFLGQYELIITTEYSQIMSLLLTFYHRNVVLYSGPYYNMFKIPLMEKIYDIFISKIINKRIKRKFVKSELAKLYLEDKGFDNIKVLGVGLDITEFENNVELNDKAKKILDDIGDKKYILYVGSIEERKNSKFIFDVFQQVYENDKSIYFVVIGKGKDNYVDQCYSNISSDCRRNIIHVTQLENKYLKYIYEKAEMFLLPSKLEIFGMVLLEAMYFGLPCITSFNGGATTLIKTGDNGIVIQDFSIELWTKQIISLLNDKSLRDKLGSNARDTIINNFTWEKVCDNFIQTIE